MIGQVIKKLWFEKPYVVIMVLAIIFRLIAVIFSRGFGMLDDHFLVIEAAQSWVDDFDYNRWLPKSGNTTPQGHSFFYVGFHYILLLFLEKIQLTDPQAKMYVVRLLHALFSLLIISFGYKITEKLFNRKTANQVGLLLAIFWFMPFLSVRNMVEIVCIPFLMWGIWIIINAGDKKQKLLLYLFAGFIMGLGFSVRFQTLIFTGSVGLVVLFHGKWKEVIFLAAGVLVSIALIQGTIDFFIWGYPFAELYAYVEHNIIHATDYIITPWYSYMLLVLGILIPPVSFFILFGFLRTFKWKKYLIIFFPTLVFFVFHSAFPNKQERFILPILPFLIILGMIGWNDFIARSKFWKNNSHLLRASWVFFWVINTILLLIISTTYSKKARVESMTYLSRYDNIKFVLVENSNQYTVDMIPRYYLDEWVRQCEISKSKPVEKLPRVFVKEKDFIPRFFIFFEEKNINERVNQIKVIYPSMEYETTIKPGFIDRLLHWLNPINANQTIFIYRNTDYFPEKKLVTGK